MTATTGRVRLPVLYCPEPDCGHQLVNHLFVIAGTDTLVCLFCAAKRAARGDSVVALQPESVGFLDEPVHALDPVDAVALLVRCGGELL